MTHRMLGVLVTLACVLTTQPAAAEPAAASAREQYTRALAQERIIRDASQKPTLAQMRRVVTLYETVVRSHPTSGYCDNALWQAANVAALAYERFGNEADRRTAERLFTMLPKEYPSSKLGAGVPAALTALAAVAAAAEAPPPPAPAPAAPAVPARKPTPDAPADSASDAPPVVLKEIQRTTLDDGVRLTIELGSEVPYHQEEIANPRRLFFDLKNVTPAPGLQDTALKFQGQVVSEVRVGRHPRNVTRLAMDLDGVDSYTVYPLYGPYRLVVDFRRAATAASTVPAALTGSGPSAGVVPAVRVEPAAPALKPDAAVSSGPAEPEKRTVRPAPDPRPAEPAPKLPLASTPATLALPPASAAANSNGKFSLSRQLGLGVSRIVIDAGHGGHDPGAHGNGIDESDLTLDVAQRLRKLLEKQDGVEVVMTRDSDVFIPLEERTAIANREGADLFLSIHANASRNVQARGVETYFLNFAMNPEAEAVAARENATSAQAMHSLPDIVKAIALNNKINESREFAETVQKSMVKGLKSRNRNLRDLGVKQAPFVVLIGAGMPSVLAEISFVTNRQDGTLLKTPAYRDHIAQALMDAVLDYQNSLKRKNAVAAKKITSQ